jgi:hypothetical protein
VLALGQEWVLVPEQELGQAREQAPALVQELELVPV